MQKYFVVFAAAVVIGILGYVVGHQPVPAQPGTQQAADQNFGAVPVLTSPVSVDGVTTYYANLPLRTSTTTPCVIKSPAATTTLVAFGVSFLTSTSTATTVQFTKGTAMQATTTALSGQLVLASGAQGAFFASTTPEATFVLAPNTWLQVSLVGGNGTVSPVGRCTAEMLII